MINDLLHGGTATSLYLGICLTDDEDIARDYAAGKNGTDTVLTIDLDITGLEVVHCDPARTDDDGNYIAPGDTGSTLGADVLVYDDLSASNDTHRTWRLMTQRAIDAATITGTLA